MDGPSITGGGGEIASAFVTIGADLSQLKAAEAEAKAIVERIGAMGGGAGTIGNPINGAGSIGGGSLTLQVKIDESAIHSQLDKAITSYSPKALTIPVQLDMSGVSAQLQSIGAITGTGGIGGGGESMMMDAYRELYHNTVFALQTGRGGLGGGGFGSGAGARGGGLSRGLRSRNPLSIYGAASRLGIPLLAAFGAEDLAELGSGLAEAGSIESHPERILRQYDQIGNSMDVMNDPIMRSLSGAKASELGRRRISSALQSLPLVGGFVGLGASLSGESGTSEDIEFAITRQMEEHQYDYRSAHEQAIRSAMLGGNLGQIAKAKLAGSEDYLRRRAAELPGLQRDALKWTAAAGYKTIAQGIAAQIASAQAAQNELREVDKNNRIEQNRADSQQGAIESGFTIGNAAAGIRGAASDMLASNPGANLAYMDQMHAAGMMQFDLQTIQAVANAPAGLQDQTRDNRFQERIAKEKEFQAQRAQAVREGEQHVSAIESQANAARLRAAHQNFNAEMQLFNDRVNQELKAAKGSPDEARITADLNSERQAMIGAHNEQVYNAFSEAGVSFNNSLLSVQAASLRAQGRGREAGLLQFQAQRAANQEQLRQAMSQLNFGNIGDVLPRIIGLAGQNLAIGANEQAAQFEDQRYLALSSYAIGARGSAAESRINNQPINAQSINAVTRAQLELANADPRERAALRATLAKELQAQEHDLMGFRSGDMAIDSGLAGSIGLAGRLDLRGVGADRRAAAKTFEQGINDINSGKVVGGNGDNAVTALNNIYRFLQSALKQIGKGSLPSMFAPN